MPGRVGFEFRFSQPRPGDQAPRSDESPLRVLVMGDLSGRGQRGADDPPNLATRRVLSVDVDNFDRVLSSIAPRLELQLGTPAATPTPIEFRHLDDFHPDRLYRDLQLFAALRETRSRLQDPATFAETAAKLQPGGNAAAEPGQPSAKVTDPARREDDAATLARVLGRVPEQPAQVAQTSARAAVDIDALMGKIVAPYIVAAPDPHQALYAASVDEASGEQMRALLHHPTFQALESVWRAIRWLIAELEIGETLQLCLLDVTRDELRADMLSAGGDVERSSLYRYLAGQRAEDGGEPWSLLVGNYTFALTDDDADLLAWLGTIASHAGGPFLAAADASVLGCRSIVETPDPHDWSASADEAAAHWAALRRSPVAQWLGLALPRILLRLPYGKQTDPVDSFDFEELSSAREHESYLWGNPAMACALLIGRAFLEKGWEMRPGDELDVGDLPAYVFTEDGAKHLQAGAELYLGERTGEAILARGVMPFLSLRNQNAARLLRFQSLADPPQPVAGRWR
jgi:type VI secretion system protein ImpC